MSQNWVKQPDGALANVVTGAKLTSTNTESWNISPFGILTVLDVNYISQQNIVSKLVTDLLVTTDNGKTFQYIGSFKDADAAKIIAGQYVAAQVTAAKKFADEQAKESPKQAETKPEEAKEEAAKETVDEAKEQEEVATEEAAK